MPEPEPLMSILVIRGPERHDALTSPPPPLPPSVLGALVQRAGCAGQTLAVRSCGSTTEVLTALRLANEWGVRATLLDPGALTDHPRHARRRRPARRHRPSPCGRRWLRRTQLRAGAGDRARATGLRGMRVRCPRRHLTRMLTHPFAAISPTMRCTKADSASRGARWRHTSTTGRHRPTPSWRHCATTLRASTARRLAPSGYAACAGCDRARKTANIHLLV